jgi:hypothetical protein
LKKKEEEEEEEEEKEKGRERKRKGGDSHSMCAGWTAYTATSSALSRTATRPISNPFARGTEMGSGEPTWIDWRPWVYLFSFRQHSSLSVLS